MTGLSLKYTWIHITDDDGGDPRRSPMPTYNETVEQGDRRRSHIPTHNKTDDDGGDTTRSPIPTQNETDDDGGDPRRSPIPTQNESDDDGGDPRRSPIPTHNKTDDDGGDPRRSPIPTHNKTDDDGGDPRRSPILTHTETDDQGGDPRRSPMPTHTETDDQRDYGRSTGANFNDIDDHGRDYGTSTGATFNDTDDHGRDHGTSAGTRRNDIDDHAGETNTCFINTYNQQINIDTPQYTPNEETEHDVHQHGPGGDAPSCTQQECAIVKLKTTANIEKGSDPETQITHVDHGEPHDNAHSRAISIEENVECDNQVHANTINTNILNNAETGGNYVVTNQECGALCARTAAKPVVANQGPCVTSSETGDKPCVTNQRPSVTSPGIVDESEVANQTLGAASSIIDNQMLENYPSEDRGSRHDQMMENCPSEDRGSRHGVVRVKYQSDASEGTHGSVDVPDDTSEAADGHMQLETGETSPGWISSGERDTDEMVSMNRGTIVDIHADDETDFDATVDIEWLDAKSEMAECRNDNYGHEGIGNLGAQYSGAGLAINCDIVKVDGTRDIGGGESIIGKNYYSNETDISRKEGHLDIVAPVSITAGYKEHKVGYESSGDIGTAEDRTQYDETEQYEDGRTGEDKYDDDGKHKSSDDEKGYDRTGDIHVVTNQSSDDVAVVNGVKPLVANQRYSGASTGICEDLALTNQRPGTGDKTAVDAANQTSGETSAGTDVCPNVTDVMSSTSKHGIQVTHTNTGLIMSAPILETDTYGRNVNQCQSRTVDVEGRASVTIATEVTVRDQSGESDDRYVGFNKGVPDENMSDTEEGSTMQTVTEEALTRDHSTEDDLTENMTTTNNGTIIDGKDISRMVRNYKSDSVASGSAGFEGHKKDSGAGIAVNCDIATDTTEDGTIKETSDSDIHVTKVDGTRDIGGGESIIGKNYYSNAMPGTDISEKEGHLDIVAHVYITAGYKEYKVGYESSGEIGTAEDRAKYDETEQYEDGKTGEDKYDDDGKHKCTDDGKGYDGTCDNPVVENQSSDDVSDGNGAKPLVANQRSSGAFTGIGENLPQTNQRPDTGDKTAVDAAKQSSGETSAGTVVYPNDTDVMSSTSKNGIQLTHTNTELIMSAPISESDTYTRNVNQCQSRTVDVEGSVNIGSEVTVPDQSGESDGRYIGFNEGIPDENRSDTDEGSTMQTVMEEASTREHSTEDEVTDENITTTNNGTVMDGNDISIIVRHFKSGSVESGSPGYEGYKMEHVIIDDTGTVDNETTFDKNRQFASEEDTTSDDEYGDDRNREDILSDDTVSDDESGEDETGQNESRGDGTGEHEYANIDQHEYGGDGQDYHKSFICEIETNKDEHFDDEIATSDQYKDGTSKYEHREEGITQYNKSNDTVTTQKEQIYEHKTGIGEDITGEAGMRVTACRDISKAYYGGFHSDFERPGQNICREVELEQSRDVPPHNQLCSDVQISDVDTKLLNLLEQTNVMFDKVQYKQGMIARDIKEIKEPFQHIFELLKHKLELTNSVNNSSGKVSVSKFEIGVKDDDQNPEQITNEREFQNMPRDIGDHDALAFTTCNAGDPSVCDGQTEGNNILHGREPDGEGEPCNCDMIHDGCDLATHMVDQLVADELCMHCAADNTLICLCDSKTKRIPDNKPPEKAIYEEISGLQQKEIEDRSASHLEFTHKTSNRVDTCITNEFEKVENSDENTFPPTQENNKHYDTNDTNNPVAEHETESMYASTDSFAQSGESKSEKKMSFPQKLLFTVKDRLMKTAANIKRPRKTKKSKDVVNYDQTRTDKTAAVDVTKSHSVLTNVENATENLANTLSHSLPNLPTTIASYNNLVIVDLSNGEPVITHPDTQPHTTLADHTSQHDHTNGMSDSHIMLYHKWEKMIPKHIRDSPLCSFPSEPVLRDWFQIQTRETWKHIKSDRKTGQRTLEELEATMPECK